MKYLPDEEIRDIWDDYTKSPTVEKQNIIFSQFYDTIRNVGNKACKKFNIPVQDWEDVISELSLKFLQRLKYFNAKKAKKPWCYVMEILPRLANGIILSNLFRMETAMAIKKAKVLKFIDRHKNETGKFPTFEQIHNATKLPIRTVKNLLVPVGEITRPIQQETDNRGIKIIDAIDEIECLASQSGAIGYIHYKIIKTLYDTKYNMSQVYTAQKSKLNKYLKKIEELKNDRLKEIERT